jgi:hypothetical protein
MARAGHQRAPGGAALGFALGDGMDLDWIDRLFVDG